MTCRVMPDGSSPPPEAHIFSAASASPAHTLIVCSSIWRVGAGGLGHATPLGARALWLQVKELGRRKINFPKILLWGSFDYFRFPRDLEVLLLHLHAPCAQCCQSLLLSSLDCANRLWGKMGDYWLRQCRGRAWMISPVLPAIILVTLSTDELSVRNCSAVLSLSLAVEFPRHPKTHLERYSVLF